jgi:hypothetical protein
MITRSTAALGSNKLRRRSSAVSERNAYDTQKQCTSIGGIVSAAVICIQENDIAAYRARHSAVAYRVVQFKFYIYV